VSGAGIRPPEPRHPLERRIRTALVLTTASASIAVITAAVALILLSGAGGGTSRGDAPAAPSPSTGVTVERTPVESTIGPVDVGRGRPQPQLSLGTFRRSPVLPHDCPADLTCSGFTVSCPGVREPAIGFLAVGAAQEPARGVVAFFSGGEGNEWWSDESSGAATFLRELRSRDLTVVQVRWETPWLWASEGERVGPARLACRPATAIGWIGRTFDHRRDGPGPCGFCVTGNSAGSSQVSYALARFGLERVLDLVVPTSGPPHAGLADGCARLNPLLTYGGHTPLLDASFGFFDMEGPCGAGSTRWADRWTRDSVESGDLFYPETAVRFIFGSLDATRAAHHGARYYLALRDRGSPRVTAWVVDCMAHRVQAWPAGLATLRLALTRPVVEEPIATSVAPGVECRASTPDKVFTIESVAESISS
jgi:hypothetical protein